MRAAHRLRRSTIAIVAAGVGCGALGSIEPAFAQTPERVELPSSIDATGATDVSAELSEFLALVPEATIVEFGENATYRIDAGLDIRRIGSITIEGNDATLVSPDDGTTADPPSRAQRSAWPRNRRIITLAGVDHVTIRNLTIDGPNDTAVFDPKLEGQAAVFVARSDFVMLDGVTVREVWGDGVYVTGGSQGVVVVNSDFDGIGRQGVAVVQGSDIQVASNRFDRVARSVIDLEPTRNGEVRDVEIRDNTIGDYANFVLAAAGGGPNVVDVTLADNTIEGGRGLSVFAGVARQPRRGLTIVDNRSQVDATAAIGPTPIRITNYADVTIERNTSPLPDDADVITLNAVCDATIEDNVWPGAGDEIVEVAACGATVDTTPLVEDGVTTSVDAESTETTVSMASTTHTSPPAAPTTGRADDDSGLPAWAALVIGLLIGALATLAFTRRRDSG
jgi:Right handed beta helix region